MKKLLAIVLAFTMVFALTACGSSADITERIEKISTGLKDLTETAEAAVTAAKDMRTAAEDAASRAQEAAAPAEEAVQEAELARAAEADAAAAAEEAAAARAEAEAVLTAKTAEADEAAAALAEAQEALAAKSAEADEAAAALAETEEALAAKSAEADEAAAALAETEEALTAKSAEADEAAAALAEAQEALEALQGQGVPYSPYSADGEYDVIPITMTMQAGYQEYQAHDSGFMTIHAGIGYIDPLGEGCYYAGIGYDEAAGCEEDIYVSDWMDANFGCGLFCVYKLPGGDIYTWDGIYGANAKDMANYMSGEGGFTPEEVNGTVPTRTDALINIIVGGTGEYQGATGILIGSTSGGGVYGTTDGMTLPQTLFKLMKGYIRIPKNAEGPSTHAVTQPFSEDRAALQVRVTDYAMVDVELRLQTGSLEEENGGPGAGIGTMLPFNAGAMTAQSGDGIRAAARFPVENYVNDNWLDAYGEPTFVSYTLDDGTVAGKLYGWQFSYGAITDPTDPLTGSGGQNALFTLIVGGTRDFAGVTGILSGHDVIADPEGWGIAEYDNDAPLCHLSLMDGWLKVPADSAVVTAGGYANDTITD